MPVRILFLDVYGVLLPGPFLRGAHLALAACGESHLPFLLDPYKVDILNSLLDVEDLRVVLSSPSHLPDDFDRSFVDQGVEVRLHDDWRASSELPPRHFGDADIPVKGWRISTWMTGHSEVVGYAVVSDDSDIYLFQNPHFVPTSYEEGIMPEHADRIRACLRRPIRQR